MPAMIPEGRYAKDCVSETYNTMTTSDAPEEIDCMVINAIVNSISVISRRPVHLPMLSWSSFNQYSAQYSFQTTGCFPT